MVAGIAPNFERVSQPIFPNEPGNGVDDNNPRSWRVALGRAVTARVLPRSAPMFRPKKSLWARPPFSLCLQCREESTGSDQLCQGYPAPRSLSPGAHSRSMRV